MKLMDLTGQTFGRLNVIQRVYPNGKYGETKWLCKCSCGNEIVATGGNLRRGKSKSCGCSRKEFTQSEAAREWARKMGLSTRKHFGCMICGSDKHYAKGLCKNCYTRRWKTSHKNIA